ncbi:MAG: hypothetical protein K2G89_03360 [Lachnospiraceae bacterium]|nr:hypothetical protein [Lachnospiraceae bacterium]
MYEVFENNTGNAIKYVFSGEDYSAEATIYKYEDFYNRTVICCSVMSGCSMSCSFCSVRNKFVRDLSTNEINEQVYTILSDKKLEDINERAKLFQIMFTGMGDPILNWYNLEGSIIDLHNKYPNAELMVSTVAPISDDYIHLINMGKHIPKISLQFSIYASNDLERSKLMASNDKFSLNQIRDLGIMWWKNTGRKVSINYCVNDSNAELEDAERLMALFSPMIFTFAFSTITFSFIAEPDALAKNMKSAKKFAEIFRSNDYSVEFLDQTKHRTIGNCCRL